MVKTKLHTSLFLTAIILFFGNIALGQSPVIELGEGEIAMNERFTITATVEGDRLRDVQGFPEIQGFVKAGQSSASATNWVNGKVSMKSSLTQNYIPRQEGTFTLSGFTMTINGKNVASPGLTIKVGPEKQRQQQSPFGRDPFDDMFGRRNNEPNEFIEVKEDAFFAVTPDKEEVYVGEPVNVDLAFYVSADNRAPMDFYEPIEQLQNIQKKVRPANAWEENFNIEQLTSEPVMINGKRYSKYKLFEATFFPFSEEDMVFPSVPWKMIRYKVAKNPSFFGRNKQVDYKTFHSRRKVVKVKPLPPHPLKEQVAVGQYSLKEALSDNDIKTGESFSYEFRIVGKGNIQSLNEPKIPKEKRMEFYPPNVSQNIRRNNGTVYGSKAFNYYGIPNEPGRFELDKYFSWIYFDPVEEKYDTLKSTKVITVSGESLQDTYISSNDMGSFYNQISLENNQLQKKHASGTFRLLANLLILASLVVSAIFIFKK